jgi:hypothetical protein
VKIKLHFFFENNTNNNLEMGGGGGGGGGGLSDTRYVDSQKGRPKAPN